MGVNFGFCRVQVLGAAGTPVNLEHESTNKSTRMLTSYRYRPYLYTTLYTVTICSGTANVVRPVPHSSITVVIPALHYLYDPLGWFSAGAFECRYPDTL